ncbi:hypothetical protein Nepgr_002830 [Nepenthes gracilis]|uniref:Uncharacterized protein n=1 Tax=Nepenthes gracilis TaxID=150966 RepID=A0AAD3P7J9_NEPGR|nr:hypothetical protein Nepgr_002830 [Nepenthes gracilis]
MGSIFSCSFLIVSAARGLWAVGVYSSCCISFEVLLIGVGAFMLHWQLLMFGCCFDAVWHCPAGCATEAFWTLYAADLVILGMLPVYCVCCCSVRTDWMASLAVRSFAWVRLRPNCRSGFKSWFGFEMNGRSRIASHMPISFAVASDFPVLDLSCRSQNRDRFWATCRILSRMGAGNPKGVSGLADMLLILSSGKQLLGDVKCCSYSLCCVVKYGATLLFLLLECAEMVAAAGNAKSGSWWLADAGEQLLPMWLLELLELQENVLQQLRDLESKGTPVTPSTDKPIEIQQTGPGNVVLVDVGPKLAPCPSGFDRVERKNVPQVFMPMINHYPQDGLGEDGMSSVPRVILDPTPYVLPLNFQLYDRPLADAESINSLAPSSSPSPHAGPAD